MTKFHIVWNARRNEGYITNDLNDAKQALSGRFRNPSSVVAEAFYGAYDVQSRGLQTIELDAIPEASAEVDQ